MPFTLQRSNSIAVGTFNIYVFQPSFIGGTAGAPDGTPIVIETDFASPGFKATVNSQELSFLVRPDRVVIETKSTRADCGVQLAEVLDRLPWTPISALGHNFVFAGARSDCEAALSTVNYPRGPSQPFSLTRRTWHVAVGREAVVYNLQLSVSADDCELSANVHLPAADVGNDARREFSKGFLEFRAQAAPLLGETLGITIEI